MAAGIVTSREDKLAQLLKDLRHDDGVQVTLTDKLAGFFEVHWKHLSAKQHKALHAALDAEKGSLGRFNINVYVAKSEFRSGVVIINSHGIVEPEDNELATQTYNQASAWLAQLESRSGAPAPTPTHNPNQCELAFEFPRTCALGDKFRAAGYDV